MKTVLLITTTLLTFQAIGQVVDDSEFLEAVRAKLEGNWRHDKKYGGQLFITTFKFNSDSTGTWQNNRTHSTAPIFILRKKEGVFYISAIDVIGGECDPRKIVRLDAKTLILIDPKTKEKFSYKRLNKLPD
jgi:hypothetical protein